MTIIDYEGLDWRDRMIVNLHQMIESELDPDPAPWADYHIDPEAQELASQLQHSFSELEYEEA